MAKLSYHTSMLESALADMQRAINAKRAIAEITLTRMCDTRLSESHESLLLRVEELEKAVRMMKLGVTPAVVHDDPMPSKKEVKSEPKVKIETKATTTEIKSNSLHIYGEWGSALKKIAELKRSLSAGFAGASVYTDGNGKFVIRMSGFFCDKLKSSETDLAIIKGVIAENEGKNAADITLLVENKENAAAASSDIEDIFK